MESGLLFAHAGQKSREQNYSKAGLAGIGQLGIRLALLKKIKAHADAIARRARCCGQIRLDFMHQPGRKQDEPALDRLEVHFRPDLGFARQPGIIVGYDHQGLRPRVREKNPSAIRRSLDIVDAAPEGVRMDVTSVIPVPGIDDRPHVVKGRFAGRIIAQVVVNLLGRGEHVRREQAVLLPQMHVQLAVPRADLFDVGSDDAFGVPGLPGINVRLERVVEFFGIGEVHVINRCGEIKFPDQLAPSPRGHWLVGLHRDESF